MKMVMNHIVHSLPEYIGKEINSSDLNARQHFKDNQLSLFQEFLCNTEEEQSRFSNSIELWDAVPRYSVSRRAMAMMRDASGNLPLQQLEFEYRQTKFNVSIQPALIEQKDKNGKPKKSRDGKQLTIAYYPSANEEIIEEVLRKMAADQGSGFFTAGTSSVRRSGVVFSLYRLREELKQCGHTRSYEEIKLSLDIMAGSNINITASSSAAIDAIDLDLPFGRSNYLAALFGVNRLDLKTDPTKKWMVHFHPFVTMCIASLSYRQFDYRRLMSHSTQLARWLHKLLILKYTFASKLKPFQIRFSTIRRDSAMLGNYVRGRKAFEMCDLSLNELKEHGVLTDINRRVEVEGRGKILDIIYELVPTVEFVKEVKAANRRAANNRLSTVHSHR